MAGFSVSYRAPPAASWNAPSMNSWVRSSSPSMAALDAAYATGEARRVMSLANAEVPGAERGSLAALAGFVRDLPVRRGQAA